MKSFNRAEIQELFDIAIERITEETGLVLEGEHLRRAVRALFRLGARLAIDNGAPVDVLLALAIESLKAEWDASEEPCGKCPGCLVEVADDGKEWN